MSDDRKAALEKITRPSTVAELYSFVGIANYFRDRIKDYSKYSKRLTEMLDPKNKRKLLQCDDRPAKDFETLRSLVISAPKLYYLEPSGEYGIKLLLGRGLVAANAEGDLQKMDSIR